MVSFSGSMAHPTRDPQTQQRRHFISRQRLRSRLDVVPFHIVKFRELTETLTKVVFLFHFIPKEGVVLFHLRSGGSAKNAKAGGVSFGAMFAFGWITLFHPSSRCYTTYPLTDTEGIRDPEGVFSRSPLFKESGA